jgi:mycothiol synthase
MEIRAATLDDVARLAAFMGRCTLAHQGVRRASEDEIHQRLTRPGTDPALDSWLVEDGDVIGFAQVWAEPGDVVCYVRVDPEHAGQGIATALLERAVRRARDLSDSPLHATSWPKDEAAGPFLEAHGFQPIRYLSLMAIDLHEPPAEPVWPTDVRVRALDPGADLRPVWEAQQSIFPEAPQGFDEWVHEYTGGGELDPTLWFVAEDDEGWAGFALCIPELAEDPGAGYVNELGVRPDRRGQGLGLALLRRTFVEFHARGKRRVALHVDVDNLTGAIRLYARAGMSPDPRLIVWEKKESRPAD